MKTEINNKDKVLLSLKYRLDDIIVWNGRREVEPEIAQKCIASAKAFFIGLIVQELRENLKAKIEGEK